MTTETSQAAIHRRANHALRIYGPKNSRWEQVPMPAPEQGQVLVRVGYVGICGSDLHYYFNGANGEFRLREPLIPGHEMSGTVAYDPSGQFKSGTPITVHPARWGRPLLGLERTPQLWPGGSYLGSASTWPHTQGAMAEFIVVDHTMVRVRPAGLPIRRAVLAEPMAVALHAIAQSRLVGATLNGARVLVSGSGPIGLLTIAALRAVGAGHITATDVTQSALESAQKQGADAHLEVSTQNLAESSYDLVFECSGNDAAVSSVATALRPGGIHVQVGMVDPNSRPIALSRVISGEIRMVGAFRFAQEIDSAIELLETRPQIEEIITQELDPRDPVECPRE